MDLSPIKDNALLLDLIKSSSGINKLIDREQDDASAKPKSAVKEAITQEQKNTVVSENISEKSSFISYNYRLRHAVPLAKSEKPEEPHHDFKKKPTIEVEDEETGELFDSELVEDEPTDNKLGKGYYVNTGSSGYSEKQSKSIKNLFQERINHIYNIGFTREPGTLVNLLV